MNEKNKRFYSFKIFHTESLDKSCHYAILVERIEKSSIQTVLLKHSCSYDLFTRYYYLKALETLSRVVR